MRSILMSHRRNLGRQTVPLYFISKAVARNIQLSYSTTRYGCRNFADGQDLHKYSVDNLEEFWREAATGVDWMRPFDTVLDMSDPSAPHGKWFVCGQLNTAYNCIDRHIYAGRGDSLALIYDSPVTGVIKKFTFNELKAATVKVASVLRQKLKVKKGDRVIIYMPNIPEAAIAMLACARIGAVHSVVFGGFSSAELATRIQDCKPTAVLASSCGIEIQKVINYKSLLDSALQLAAETHTVKHCLVLQRQLPDTLPALNVPMQQGRDLDWAESVEDPQLELDESCEPMQSTDPLYILYTSGMLFCFAISLD